MIKNKRCCATCRYYEADWPYKICHFGGTYSLFSGDAGEKVCQSYEEEEK